MNYFQVQFTMNVQIHNLNKRRSEFSQMRSAWAKRSSRDIDKILPRQNWASCTLSTKSLQAIIETYTHYKIEPSVYLSWNHVNCTYHICSLSIVYRLMYILEWWKHKLSNYIDFFLRLLRFAVLYKIVKH